MGYASMREFLQALEDSGELVRVRREIESPHEVFTIIWELAQRDDGPAAVLERVRGSQMPIAINLIGTLDRFAMACGFPRGLTPRELRDRYIEALQPRNWQQPRLVADAPCQEVVLTDDQVDLTRLPIFKWHPSDGGAYITLGTVITRDEKWGYNAAVYRMMLHDRRTTGVMCNIFQDAGIYNAKAKRGGALSVPAAVAIGGNPALYEAAVTKVPLHQSEYDFTSALLGQPLSLTRCRTNDLEVPADAEIVLEGEIRLDDPREEGPYGEWMGYHEESMTLHTFHCKAITMRRKPIYYTTIEGPLRGDAEIMRMIPQMATFTMSARERVTGFVDAWMPESGHNYTVVATIRKRYPAWGKQAIYQLLGMPYVGSSANIVIVTDDDIDPSNLEQVMWALSTRVDPAYDIITTAPIGGYPLNPAASARPSVYSGTGYTDVAFVGKLGIDATNKGPEEGRMRPASNTVLPLPEIQELVRANWSDYGFRR